MEMRLRGYGGTYAFNGPKAAELSLKILFIRLVAETRDDQGLECVAANIRIFLRAI